MDFDRRHPLQHTISPVYLHLHNMHIRAYSFFIIDPTHYLSTKIITQSLQCYHHLSYPYAWFVYRNLAIVVNANDIQQQPQHGLGAYDQVPPLVDVEPADAVVVLDEIGSDQISNSFQPSTGSRHHTRLNKKVIVENLKVTNYLEREEEEICAICQIEFENKEKVGELQCGHLYHPNCIQQWIIRRNVCPLCKGQALKV